MIWEYTYFRTPSYVPCYIWYIWRLSSYELPRGSPFQAEQTGQTGQIMRLGNLSFWDPLTANAPPIHRIASSEFSAFINIPHIFQYPTKVGYQSKYCLVYHPDWSHVQQHRLIRTAKESHGCRCSPFPHSWGCQYQRDSCNRASDTGLPPPKFLSTAQLRACWFTGSQIWSPKKTLPQKYEPTSSCRLSQLPELPNSSARPVPVSRVLYPRSSSISSCATAVAA